MIWISIEISPILEWAWAILTWGITWVWIFCILVAAWILWQGAVDHANRLVKGGKAKRHKKVSRVKE